MRRFDPRWTRLALAAALVAPLIAIAPAPAGAAAAPPRDTSRFGCPSTLPAPFADIDGSVHEQAIRCMAALGFVRGRTTTAFDPRANVTRGQLASFLARYLAFSGAPLDPTDQGFTDVAGSVHEDAINALAQLGIARGTTASTFGPNRPITRAQAASLMARTLAAGGPPLTGPDAFADDDTSVHEDAINGVAAIGIVGGITPDRFAPGADITRGAAASILARAHDYAVEAQLTYPAGSLDAVYAALRGDAEVPGPGDDGARGSVELVRTDVDGLLCLTWDIDGPLNDAPTAAHLHTGAVGVAGPVLLPLPVPHVAAGERTYQTTCAPDLDQAAIDAVFAAPAAHYVNIHTAARPDGAIRGQLSPIRTPLGTLLSGREVEPGPGEVLVIEGDILVDADGDALVDVLADGTTLCSAVFYAGEATPVAAHLHKAAAEAVGPVAITLAPFDADAPFSDGCIGGLDPAVVADVAANPAGYYVDVHTDEHPEGAVRGQLGASALLEADLTGAAEAPGPGDPDGAGEVSLDLVGDGQVCLRLHVRGIDRPTMASIHDGDAGVAGPIVMPLPTPIFGTVFGCVGVEPALFAALAADPGGYYVNVHTAAFPAGAVRGQLAHQDLGS